MTAPRNLGVRYGKLTTTGATFVIYSLVSTDVTLVVDGTSYNVTLSAVGTDRATNDPAGSTTFGYVGSKAVTFSPGFTRRNWTATQGANSVTGTILPAPGERDNFALVFTTCQQSRVDNDGTKFAPSAYKFVDWYRQNGSYPLVANIHSDDLIYADGTSSDGIMPAVSDPNGKKIEATAASQATRKAYDFAMYYGCLFGIAGPIVDSATGEEWLNAGLLPYVNNLYNNCAFMPQWGDHEFMNNLGWMLPTTNGPLLSAVPNPYHATLGGYNGNGLITYNAILAPLQGTTARSADTDSNHWYVDFGTVRIVAMDATTKAVPNYPNDATAVFGNSQIDDVLNVLNVRKPFKILLTPIPFMRATPNADAINTSVNGSNTKYWQNKQPTEYNRLFVNTGQTPKSIMDNNETNGGYGTTVNIYGDWHFGLCLYQQAPAATGIAAEKFHCIGLCGAVQHSGTSLNGDEIRITSEAIYSSDNMQYFSGGAAGLIREKPYKSVVALMEVVSTGRTPTMTIKVYDLREAAASNDPSSAGSMASFMNTNLGTLTDDEGNVWQCVYERKFVLYTGNYGYTASETTWENAGVSVGSVE